MRNVFFSCIFKKPQTNEGNLGGRNLWVTVHFLAEFYHYHVLIHMQTVHILLMNTEKRKRKSTGQIQEMKLPVELETHKKRNYLKTYLGIWSSKVTLVFPEQHKASRNSHQVPCRVCHPGVSARVPTFSPRATELPDWEEQRNACGQVQCWGAESNIGAVVQTKFLRQSSEVQCILSKMCN